MSVHQTSMDMVTTVVAGEVPHGSVNEQAFVEASLKARLSEVLDVAAARVWSRSQRDGRGQRE